MKLYYLYILYPIATFWGSFYIWEITDPGPGWWWGFPLLITLMVIWISSIWYAIDKIVDRS